MAINDASRIIWASFEQSNPVSRVFFFSPELQLCSTSRLNLRCVVCLKVLFKAHCAGKQYSCMAVALIVSVVMTPLCKCSLDTLDNTMEGHRVYKRTRMLDGDINVFSHPCK